MKSSQFSRKPKSEEFQHEKPAIRKNKFNWGIVIYASIVIILLFFVVKFLINEVLFVSAEGQVLYKKLDVQLPADVQLLEIYESEGNKINAGDTLFGYMWSEAFNPFKGNTSNFDLAQSDKIDPEWIQKESARVLKDIEQLRIDNQKNRDLLEMYQNRMKKVEEGVYLNVYTVDQLDQIKEKIRTLKANIRSNYAEVRYLRKYIDQLNEKKEQKQAKNSLISSQQYRFNRDTIQKYAEFYQAPMGGALTSVYKNDFEVAGSSEKIMAIYKKKEIIIRAYFNQEDLEYVNKGDQVKIQFPDGSESEGKIERFYRSTYELPKEFQQKNEPTQRRIAADIKPLKKEKLGDWKTYYKMSVKVTKRVY